MSNDVLFAAEMIQDGTQAYLSTYFEAEEKKGYVILPLGSVRGQEIFWQGLLSLVGKFYKRYGSRPLHFIMSEAYRNLGKGPAQHQTVELLRSFSSLKWTSDPIWEERLQQAKETVCMEQTIKPLRPVCLTSQQLLTQQEITKKKNTYLYYTEPTLPDSFVIFDIECTSKIQKYAYLIEIAAIRIKNREIVERFSTLINPGIRIPRQVRLLTGIEQKDVEGAPRVTQALRSFLSFIGDTSVIAGHNVRYDVGVLRATCARFGLHFPTVPLLCSLKLARKMKWDVENHQLTTLTQFIGASHDRPHRADSDVDATFELLLRIEQEANKMIGSAL